MGQGGGGAPGGGGGLGAKPNKRGTYCASLAILFYVDKVAVFKVNLAEFRLFDEPGGVPSLELLHEQEHMVVGPSGEQNLACVQLVERACDRPHVQRAVVRQSEDCGRNGVANAPNKKEKTVHQSRRYVDHTSIDDVNDVLISGAR